MTKDEKILYLKELCKDGVYELTPTFYIGIHNNILWLYCKPRNNTGYPVNVEEDHSELYQLNEPLETIYQIVRNNTYK